MSRTSEHLPQIDCLRGVAAIAVCLFHFACGNIEFLANNDPIKIVASYGWLGVEAFFVISGFVLPYAMWKRNYKWHDAADFLLRRLKRLHPPYLAAILLVIVLNSIACHVPGFRGTPYEFDALNLAVHFAYLNSILGFTWLNPVFWTLAIEIQYYGFLCVAFPLFTHGNLYVRMVTLFGISFLSLALGSNNVWLPHWLPLFGLGIVAFQLSSKLIGYVPATLMALLFSYQAYSLMTLSHAIVGICSASILLTPSSFFQLPLKSLKFLGAISYSIYLVHAPVGGKIISLSCRLPNETMYRYGGLVLAMAATIVCAFVFWKLIEVPSQRWAAYKGRLLTVSKTSEAKTLAS